ncbi:Hint domain-containing protein [Aestuariibius sp. 2305UL40-4]|uniref:Hint domain-containing protein n=1 Tax=Aestuariibius violaceus TaxID=3234132 RepID=UPI00345ED5D8
MAANNLEFNIICFGRGTPILCADGQERLVEDLEAGDLVVTKDNGNQPIRWIGSTKLTQETLTQFPERRPIRFTKDALGTHEEFLVSPQHRVLLNNELAELYYGSNEMLAPAKALVNDKTIRVADDLEEVEYYHILFNDHELIRASGAWSESFYPGKFSMDTMEHATRDEVVLFFPELEDLEAPAMRSVRPSLKPWEVRVLYPEHIH